MAAAPGAGAPTGTGREHVGSGLNRPGRQRRSWVSSPDGVRPMRIVLADIKGGDGFISKDTVVGGYGSRLKPFSKVTRVIARLKGGFHDMPSVHLGYAAALAARAGHEVVSSAGELVDGDVAIVLSSLVDHRREVDWAKAMRARGTQVGFIGLTSQKLPQLFEAAADFIVDGEPESALLRMFGGE